MSRDIGKTDGDGWPMSTRRAVILAVTVEDLSQAEAARLYDVSESFVS